MLLSETLKFHDQEKYQFHYCIFSRGNNDLVEDVESNGGKIFLIDGKNINKTLFLSIPKIIRYIRDNEIDILHCHLPLVGVVGRIIRLYTGCKLIYTEHNLQESYNKITGFLNKITYPFQEQVFACSEEVLKSISKNIAKTPEIDVLQNCIDTSRFINDPLSARAVREKHNIAPETVLIGTVVSFREQKRLKLWLDICHSVSRKCKNTQFILVGGGALYTEIKDYRDKNNIDCIMVGVEKNTSAYYSAFDVFLMSSEFEGLPLALLEAMSSGCAVVTTNAGGIPQVINHEQDGLMSDVADISGLESNLVRIIEDKELRISCIESARTKVIEKFSIQQLVSKLEKSYSEHCRSV